MIRQTHCVVLVCDGCAAVLSHPDTECEIHYDRAEQARTDAVEDLHWSAVGQRDLCPACTCAAQGHDWPAWVSPPPPSPLGPYRCCERCDALQTQAHEGLGEPTGAVGSDG